MFLLSQILIISSFAQFFFWHKALTAFVFLSGICLLLKFGLRRFRYKDNDLKAAGLNHYQRRKWRAYERQKLKRGRRARKRTVHRY